MRRMAIVIATLLLGVSCGSTGSTPVQTPRMGGTLNYALDENNPRPDLPGWQTSIRISG